MKSIRHYVWIALVGLAAWGMGACKDDDGGTPAPAGPGAVDAAAAPDAAAPGPDGAATGSDGPAPDAVTSAPPVTCSGQSDKAVAVVPAAGRKLFCAFDLGSKSAKLQVISVEPGKPLSFKDERLCKSTLGFGAKVFDAKTMVKSALSAADIANLVTVVKEFKKICVDVDKGTFVGAEATQWARDATNIAEVKAQVVAEAGIDIEVLSTEEEGQYGYTAATRDGPMRFSLDPGSNSFQIGWLEKDAAKPRTVSVDFGYVRAAAVYYTADSADSYEVARGKHAADLTAKLDQALAALTPPTSLAALKTAITDGKLKPEIFLAGQDGALHLSVRALLRGADNKWIDTKDDYDKRVAMEKATPNPTFGDVTTVLGKDEIAQWFTTVVQPTDYAALRTKAVRDLYGEKALANTVLLDVLIKQLGIDTVVLVPQEMPAGYILAKAAKL